MAKFNIVLLVVVVLTGLYTVQVQYESRRLFTALDRAVADNHRLETDNARLSVEKRAEATSLRVESLAKAKLNMRVATPATTESISGEMLPAPKTTEAAQLSVASQASQGSGEEALR